MAANQYSKECAERVFQEIGGTAWSSLQALRDCAGSTEEDRENALLEEELKSQHGDGQAVGEVMPDSPVWLIKNPLNRTGTSSFWYFELNRQSCHGCYLF